jgi:DHA1 family bicyclomycin/chloramphenicol resistance-like MFS transporter
LNKKETSPPLTLLLGVLISLSALGTDLYVPALPSVAQAFAAPVSRAQATITTYFVGLAAGQLLWGPLSDRYGRKPVLLVALALMLGATAAAALAGSVAAIVAARLAQGMGMAGGVVLGRSIVRDLHAHEQAARLLSRMMIVFSFVPIAAPLAGAMLVSSAGWRAIFWTYAAIAVALGVAVAAGLRETATARPAAPPAEIARRFREILADRRFVAPFLLLVGSQMAIICWVSNSAFALVREGVSARAYGFMFAGVMLGQIAGAWASSRLVLRIGIGGLLRAGSRVALAGGGAAALLAWAGVAHWLALVAPFAVLLFGTALIIPNASAAALSPFPHAAGAASSLMGAVGFACGALVSALLGAAFDGTPRPMASAAALAALGVFVCERMVLRGKA